MAILIRPVREQFEHDRVIRIAVGAAILAIGLSEGMPWWTWLGLIPIGTALVRWCPLYLPFGIWKALAPLGVSVFAAYYVFYAIWTGVSLLAIAYLRLGEQQNCVAHHGIDSCLEMEFETHFQQFFMPTMRGSEQGSKKRYAGLIDDGQGERHIVFKGLEAVRTDWTELARQFQQTLYRLVFDGADYTDYIRELVADLYAGKLDAQLVYRKRLRKKLSEYQKNVPPHAQAAIKASRPAEA